MTDDPSWSVGDSYDPKEFNVLSRDKRGFDKSIRVYVPPGIHGKFHELASSPQLPFGGNIHALIRYCLKAGVHQLNAVLPTDIAQELIQVMKAEWELDHELTFRQLKESQLKKAEDLAKIGGTERALAIIRNLMIHESDPKIMTQYHEFTRRYDQ